MDGKEYRKQIADLREKHVLLVRAFLGKTAQALAALETKEASLSDVTNALRLLNNILGQPGAGGEKQKRPAAEDPLSTLRVVGATRKGTA